MSIAILRGDARSLPLPDESVDLIVTSPPYFGQRSYTDKGQHYAGQIGSEGTPQEYVAALIACTREWARVLKPSGSLFVNLGDKYSGSGGDDNSGLLTPKYKGNTDAAPPAGGKRWGHAPKSLLALPARYLIGCIDETGLTARRDIIWHKTNPLPESVTDRCATSHEYLFHLTKGPRYYSAADEVREPPSGYFRQNNAARAVPTGPHKRKTFADAVNPLGKMPGSVWDIPSQPLVVPAQLGIDHFAAFPAELPRRCILGWSPPGICTACDDGRHPVVDKPGLLGGDNNPFSRDGTRTASTMDGGAVNWARRMASPDRITGYACSCTPFTDHPGTQGRDRAGQSYARETGRDAHPHGGVGMLPRTGPWREYHLDGWTPPPSRPAVVLDPFSGTGTTLLTADVLGRDAIGIDRSFDYCQLAKWRTTDPGERARAKQVPKPPVVPDGQGALFDASEAAS